mgnify:FL=1
MPTPYSHPCNGRLETEYHFFLLLGLRLKGLLIGLGIKPLVLLCFYHRQAYVGLKVTGLATAKLRLA